MEHHLPSVMCAVVVREDRTVAVEERPIPTLEENEILVQVESAAQNPTDWKCIKFAPDAPGSILGCDFSGTVVQVAEGCKGRVTIGDHVAGFVHGGQFKNRGAFADYLKADSDLVWTVPGESISHDEASTMGCTLYTAAHALSHLVGPGLPDPRLQTTSKTWIFIYGGSTSVGQFAIQLAHLAGYQVVTVASSLNHEFLKSLGANVVLDYKSPNFVSEIKAVTNDEVHVALDTFSTDNSQLLSVNVLGPGAGKVVVLNPIDERAKNLRSDIDVEFTVVFVVLGRPFDFLGAHVPVYPEERASIVEFLRRLPALVTDGAIKPNKVNLWPGGLDGVKDGLAFMLEGKVRGQKIVYRPSRAFPG